MGSLLRADVGTEKRRIMESYDRPCPPPSSCPKLLFILAQLHRPAALLSSECHPDAMASLPEPHVGTDATISPTWPLQREMGSALGGHWGTNLYYLSSS